MMKLLEKQFLALVNAGLGGDIPDISLFHANVEWVQIIELARKQTLLGVVYDGMLTLPKEFYPSRPVLLQWSSYLFHIEDNNRLLNKALQKLFATYEENGVTPILMKGQGLALNYPESLHRQCGDIDVYVNQQGLNLANNLLVGLGGKIINVSSRRSLCKWDEITIENHCRITEFGSPMANWFLKKEMEKVPKSHRKVLVNDAEIKLLPLELDVMFVLVHLILHLFYEGVGLRQVCDWICMLHRYKNDIDKKELERLLRGVGFYNAAKVVAAIGVTYLGLPKSDVPFTITTKDFKEGQWLLTDILEGGNFGFFRQANINKPKNWFKRKCYALNNVLKRCRKFYYLAPNEAWFYPFRLMITVIRIRIYLYGKKRSDKKNH